MTDHRSDDAMTHLTYRAALLALYQFAVALGIALLPVALLARHVGVHLPLGRLVERLGNAYDEAAA